MSPRNKEFKLWPKQLEAFHSTAQEILYGGAAGPGKSHLLRIMALTFCMMIPGLQVYLFRRNYRDLIQGHIEGPTGFKALLAEMEEAGFVKIVELEIRFKNGPTGGFDGGSRISLNHCSHEQDCLKYKTIEFHFLMIEEATEFTEFMVRFLRSRVRMPSILEERIPEEFKGRFPRVLYATNPGGPGHGYFKRAFVDAAEHGTIFVAPDEDGGFTRQFISAKLSDNPSVNPDEYRKRLAGIGSPAYVEALLNGDWSAPVGAYYTEFDVTQHVIPDFYPPSHWFRFRTFDWGSAEPFAVYWWAVSDGESFTDEMGAIRWLPKGALVAYREWYGCNPISKAEGLRLRNPEIAAGILSRNKKRIVKNHLGEDVEETVPEEQNLITLTDSLPFQDRGGKTPAAEMAEGGVILTKGDDSRVSGWSLLRGRLRGVEVGAQRLPLIYFCVSCWAAIEYIPMLPYHPNPAKREDAAEHGEYTHSPDAVRIACTARARIKHLETEENREKPVQSNRLTFDHAIKQVQQIKLRINGNGY